MYEEFYGLQEKPFSLTPDPKFFFLSEYHRAAFEHLLYGIRQKAGFLLIIGEVGTGKTTLCRALLERMEKEVNVALIFNPSVSEVELLQAILTDFDLKASSQGKKTTRPSKKGLVDELNRFLLEEQAKGRTSVLIIDEAQALSLQVLEEVRLLSNLETEKEKLLQIILMGQPELKEKLDLPDLRQLNQRFSIRYTLQPLRKEDVSLYINHRLVTAGATNPPIFTTSAMRAIHAYSKGIPRLINITCDRTLLGGYTKGSYRISSRIVQEGIQSIKGEYEEGGLNWIPKRSLILVGSLVLFFASLLFALFSIGFRWPISDLWSARETSSFTSEQSAGAATRGAATHSQRTLPVTPPTLARAEQKGAEEVKSEALPRFGKILMETPGQALQPDSEQAIPAVEADSESNRPSLPQKEQDPSPTEEISEVHPPPPSQAREEPSAVSVSEPSEPSPQSEQLSKQVRAQGKESPASEELRAENPEPKTESPGPRAKSPEPSEGSRPQDHPYTVQVASLSTEDEALNEVETAEELGYPVFLAKTERIGGETQYRIFLGRFASYREAKAVQNKLQQQGNFSSAFVVYTAKRWEENESHR